MIIILMGVTGSGKTTLGKLLSEKLGWKFYDGDDYHSPENIRKMSTGIPLTDVDRQGWLETLADMIRGCLEREESAVLACSALKQSYREVLNVDPQQVRFVYLKGSPELIYARVNQRSGHYMKAGMVKSQFAALEEPDNVLIIAVNQSPLECLNLIISGLHLRGSNPQETPAL
jgi:gluconokinase